MLWIKNGQLVDPIKGVMEQLDLVIEDGRIAQQPPRGVFKPEGEQIEVIDAAGKVVVPGLLDMHVHLREPGFEYKETIASGTLAALAGGFTGVACMPNTAPANDCRAVTEFILQKAARAGFARVYPIAAISVGQKGEMLSDFGDLKEGGAVAVSDDGFPVVSSELMRRALEYGRYHGLMVISHSEDLTLSGDGVMHEGFVSTRIGLAGIPDAAEDIMVYREISLARLTGCPVHIAHVSTATSVELIRRAKEENLPVTAETAPHYFSLDHNALRGYDTNAKVNPPLRALKDVEAIKRGLAEGVIDVIASDHAPHSVLEKEVEFDKAAFGLIGLQTTLPLTLGLVREGVLGLPEAIAKLSLRPSRILGLGGGHLEAGSIADLAVIDPDVEYEFKASDVLSKSKNSPFIGRVLKGRSDLTLMGGKVVWRRIT